MLNKTHQSSLSYFGKLNDEENLVPATMNNRYGKELATLDGVFSFNLIYTMIYE